MDIKCSHLVNFTKIKEGIKGEFNASLLFDGWISFKLLKGTEEKNVFKNSKWKAWGVLHSYNA